MPLVTLASVIGSASPGNASANSSTYFGSAASFASISFSLPDKPEFDRIVAEHRHQRLRLELALGRVGPGQHRTVGDVAQAHAAARMHLAGDADAARLLVGEGAILLVARRARERVVDRQPRVVEQVAAQLHLLGAHRVVGRHLRPREARRQVPHVAASGARRRERQLHAAKRPHVRHDLPPRPLGEVARGGHAAFGHTVADYPVDLAVDVLAHARIAEIRGPGAAVLPDQGSLAVGAMTLRATSGVRLSPPPTGRPGSARAGSSACATAPARGAGEEVPGRQPSRPPPRHTRPA